MLLSDTEVVDDLLVDGLKIVQNTKLYRFGSDAILLSRFARAKKGDAVADFCAGSGIVAFHFYALNRAKNPLSFELFELQGELLQLAEKTAALNGFENFSFREGDLKSYGGFREQFSLVLCNPPYERGGFENADEKKAICRKELTITLGDVVKAAKKALKFGGRIALVNRADRVAEIAYTFHEHGIELKRLQFVSGTKEKAPYLVLAEGVKGGKAGTEILPTLINGKE